jgi:peptidoglycan/LPS O-acetylase OafA/YrhL
MLQLDGLRGLAVLGVMWFHWAPPQWRGPLPFEIGLFFFFVASGFLVTGRLLRERDAGTARRPVYQTFLARRGLRILIPYFAALGLAALLGAGDLREAPAWYVLPACNLRMALTGAEPAGITHFWTLAIQQQFYLAWPLLVLFLPRRLLAPVLAALVLAAPLWRLLGPRLLPGVPDPSLLGPATLDYLGCGSLLALARAHRPAGRLPGLAPLAWVSFAAYAVLYARWVSGHPLPGLRWFQQTFLAIACCGLLDAATRGLGGTPGRLLAHPLPVALGTLSYSLYLFHNLAPLLAGWLFPILWHAPPLPAPVEASLRLLVFGAISWALAAASWRWLERPAERLRDRLAAAPPTCFSGSPDRPGRA